MDSHVDATAVRVGRNAADLRGRLPQAEVVRRLEILGVPMLKTTLSKLENADRKITVSELIALAIALGVTPNRLLLPGTAGNEDLELTPTVTACERAAWLWATGDNTLYEGDVPAGVPRPDPDFFRSVNRPHVQADTTTDDEMAEYRQQLSRIDEAAAFANVEGVPPRIVAAYLRRSAWLHPLRFSDDIQGA